jgi:hypothetical protein
MKVKCRRTLVDAHQTRRRARRRSGHKMLDQPPLLQPTQTTLSHPRHPSSKDPLN